MTRMKRPGSLDSTLADVKYEQYINNLHDRLPSLIDPRDIDCNRWPWELVQNAKDTVVHRAPERRFVDVIFRYYKDKEGKLKLCFQHNGAQFSDKAITGIIWKFSAEKRNEMFTEDGLSRDKQSTGRFGTGFMTTHALSLIVDVEGSMYNGDEGVERNVSVNFTLHREGPTDEMYKKGVQRTEEEMEFDRIPVPSGEELPTKFTYHIVNASGMKAAEMGLENVRLNAAQTMLFCPTVRSIEVIDEIKNNHFKISRSDCNYSNGQVQISTFIEYDADKKTTNKRKFVSLAVEEPSTTLSKYWHDNRNLRLHIGVEVDADNKILPIPSSSPSIYCSLPLIGFEKMLLPFYINSNDFEPATERTSLYLYKLESKMDYIQGKNEYEEHIIPNGVNWSILRRSTSLYETLVDYLIQHDFKDRFNLIRGLNETLKSSWSDEEKNCLAARFILPLRNMLVKKDLVNTTLGYRSILNDHIKFMECREDRNRTFLYKICHKVFPTDLPLETENQKWVDQQWSKFSFSADFEEKLVEEENPLFPIVNYGDIAKYIESAKTFDNLKLVEGTDTLSWLNDFYKWISDAKLTILAEKSIVPNRQGLFCSCETGCNLKDASEIPTSVFDFMKKLNIDWDKKLLLEGVENVSLEKETTDNITNEIKDKTKEVIDAKQNVFEKLLPILLAIPEHNDGRTTEFFQKRNKIIGVIKTMYPSKVSGSNSITLGLKSETWKNADDWFMDYAIHEISNRKKLDIQQDGINVENLYCTKEWLSDLIYFMFEKGYLHLDDITENDSSSDTLNIIPNSYGDFISLNKLFKQGNIPNELLNECLKSTGFDIKKVLLCDGFKLHERINITDYPISTLATKYTEFFENKDADGKVEVANFLLHLIPNCGEQFEEERKLYDEFAHSDNIYTTIISTSDLTIWKGAKDFMIRLLAEKASNCNSILELGHILGGYNVNQPTTPGEEKRFFKIGMSWLNRLAIVITKNKITIDDSLKLIPDWKGILHSSKDMTYDGSILNQYKNVQTLIDIKESDLWGHLSNNSKNEGDDEFISTVVNPDYCDVAQFRDNTDEKLFGIIDNLIFYCCNNNDTTWREILKTSIETLLEFFDENSSFIKWGAEPKWTQFFRNTYTARKEMYYDFVCDADTKARISRINDNFSPDEIDKLIKDKEEVKQIIANKDYYKGLERENKALQEKIEEFSDLHTLLKEYSTDEINKVKEFINKLTNNQSTLKNEDIPLSGEDCIDIAIVPKTYEIEVRDYKGQLQTVKADQIQYAGLSLEEIERYVEEAKGAVVKYFKELNEKENLGLIFDLEKIRTRSYSQLYGIKTKDGRDIPIVVHSYKGPEYRYFDLNWYDWQLLSQDNAMLFVLTVSGLQCIPLYALPVRNLNFNIDNQLSDEKRAALLTLAAVGKHYSSLNFDFGNNMPCGFTDPLPFNYVPKELEKCILSIKDVCDRNIPLISDVYNSGHNIPLVSNALGFSKVMEEMESVTMREVFDAPINELKAPLVGTTFIE